MSTQQVHDTRVVARVSAPVSKPEVQTGKDASGRTVSVARMHYDSTKSWFNKSATSENRFVAAMQKTGNLAVAFFCAIGETFRNLFAGSYNVFVATPINLIGGLFHKEAKKAEEPKKTVVQPKVVQEQPKPVEPEKVVLPVKRTFFQKLSDGTSTAIEGVKSAATNAATAVKNNPGKTALAVATGVAAYYGYKHLTAQPSLCTLPANTGEPLSHKIGEAMASNCRIPPVVEGACRDPFFDLLETTRNAYETSRPTLWSSAKGFVGSVLGTSCRGTAAITPAVAKNAFKSLTQFPGCPKA